MKRYLPFLFLAACACLALGVQSAGQSSSQPQQQQQPAAEGLQLSGTEMGNGLFERKCLSCHENPASGSRAPAVAALRQMTPEAIYAALTAGSMASVVGNQLTDLEKRRVAETVSGRLLGSTDAGDAKTMSNRCASNPPLADPLAGPAWNGWGAGIQNARFQSEKSAGISAGDVPRLQLKWAFGFPAGISAYGQPTIVAGRVFVASDNGYVYSLDAKTGCVYWSFQAKAAMRTAITIGPVKGQGSAKYAAYFGDLKANVYAIDAADGKLLWTGRVEEHSTARVVGAPTLYGSRLFVPVSFFEGFAAATLDYPCCTSRGSVVALDANTGRQLWETYAISEEPKPVRKNSKGTQLWAPAGASIWNSPTVDPLRHAIYFGTGDSETYPAPETTDSILALDMRTGKRLWFFQGLAGDTFLGGCDDNTPNRSDNCPPHQGPDWDFGNSPILRTLPNGRRVLVAAQKSGVVFGLDPDRNGALLWKMDTKPLAGKTPGSFGLIVWGGAADSRNAYYALRTGGIIALQLHSGKQVWYTPIAPEPGAPSDADAGVSAAVTAIPGVLFAGGWDGRLHAFSTVDGRILWQFDTVRDYKTVNGVPARGGAFGSAGPTVAGGMLFVDSGYGVINGGQAGNVLLAFSAK
ncbi:MAG: PQQ-binding-like beta-propeller repeat protein [Acidobacteriia bacterium]|nr:PQQ-binding-like beta-propeller repeat protein [Terriglobia bacterium]